MDTLSDILGISGHGQHLVLGAFFVFCLALHIRAMFPGRPGR